MAIKSSGLPSYDALDHTIFSKGFHLLLVYFVEVPLILIIVSIMCRLSKLINYLINVKTNLVLYLFSRTFLG